MSQVARSCSKNRTTASRPKCGPASGQSSTVLMTTSGSYISRRPSQGLRVSEAHLRLDELPPRAASARLATALATLFAVLPAAFAVVPAAFAKPVALLAVPPADLFTPCAPFAA